VFVPTSIKETNYMAYHEGLPPLNGPGDMKVVGRSITRLSDYQRLYRGRRQELVAADVSPTYLYHPNAPRKIAELAPHAKIVMILRNPVECALSMFAMMRRDKREPCRQFWQAFERSEQRMADGWEWAWDYQGLFKFFEPVSQYLKLFPRSQLFIRRYEDVQESPLRFYSDLTRFLGLPMIDVNQANQRINTAPKRIDMLKKKRLGRGLCWVGRLAGVVAPGPFKAKCQRYLDQPAYVLSPGDRQKLIEHFGDDIYQLSGLLSWDVSDWLRA
jgi:hypothetical protein